MDCNALDNYKYDMQNIEKQYNIKIKLLEQQIENLTIEKHIKLHENKLKYNKYIDEVECKQLLKVWFEKMLSCCKQGTYGHRVSWSNNVPSDIFGKYIDTPHHWICDTNNLHILNLVPKLKLYCELNNIVITIASKAHYELWK